MLLAIALWTFFPAQSFAQRASKTSIKGAAGATGVVIGKSVRNEKGDILGTVENVVLTENGCVRY